MLLPRSGFPIRLYSASLVFGDAVIVPWFALALEPAEYSSAPGVAIPPGAVFAHTEKIWREAAATLAEDWDRAHDDARSGPLDGASSGIASIERRALPAGGDPRDVPHFGPAVYCKKVGVLFEPLCPTCLGALCVCDDERILRASGLPSYATTLARFLHCAACGGVAGTPRVFYTDSHREWDNVADGARVRRRSELYRDLAPRISSGASGEASGTAHPCFTCEHRALCYPAGRDVTEALPAEAFLFPFAYFGSRYLPLEMLPLGFDEICALLGGASADSFQRERPALDAQPAAHLFSRLDRAFAAPAPQFFFEGDPTGLFALESFLLRMGAFAGLARGVLRLHESGRPHFALTPDRVRGSHAPMTPLVPARWGLSLRVADVVTSAPLEERDVAPRASGATDRGGALWSPPHPLPEAFLPEAMSKTAVDQLWMRLVARSVRVETRPAGVFAHLEAELTSENYVKSEHGRNDRVRVLLQTSAGAAERILFTGARTADHPGGFLFAGIAGPLSPDAAKAVEASRGAPSLTAEVTIHHAFHAPADLMSLGLLLLRLLLTNDRQEGARIQRDAISRVVRAVTGGAGRSRTRRGGARGSETSVVLSLSGHFAGEGFSAEPSALVYRESERSARPAAISRGLWEDALRLALRMASNVPGFSICASVDDYDAADPAAPMRRCLEEIDLLVERARGELIGSSGRNTAVIDVCADFLADVRAHVRAGGDDEPSEESDVERTMIGPRKGKR
ncbi:MAG: hypothetical protein ACKVU1_11355 [bacterium]